MSEFSPPAGHSHPSTGSPRPEIRRRGVVAVVQQADRLLLIRRSLTVSAPGRLCFPGGGIEPGESEPEALVREFQEELGTAVSVGSRLWESVTPWGVHLTWWGAQIAPQAELVPNPAEVAAVLWHTPAEMARLEDLLESNHHFLAALARGELTLPAN